MSGREQTARYAWILAATQAADAEKGTQRKDARWCLFRTIDVRFGQATVQCGQVLTESNIAFPGSANLTQS